MTGLVLLSDAETGALLALLDAAGSDRHPDGRRGRDRGRDPLPLGRRVDRGRRLRRQRRRDGEDVQSPRFGRGALGRRRGPRRRASRSGSAPGSRRPGQAALAADIVVTVTPGQDVLFPAGSLREGQHVSLMGADGPGKAEVAVAELARADLFCDDWEQASHGGELAAAVEAGASRGSSVTQLGDVLAGDGRGPADRRGTSRCSTRPGSRSRISRSPRSPRPRRAISSSVARALSNGARADR